MYNNFLKLFIVDNFKHANEYPYTHSLNFNKYQFMVNIVSSIIPLPDYFNANLSHIISSLNISIMPTINESYFCLILLMIKLDGRRKMELTSIECLPCQMLC